MRGKLEVIGAGVALNFNPRTRTSLHYHTLLNYKQTRESISSLFDHLSLE